VSLTCAIGALAFGCAGELTRGERPVIVGRPVPAPDAAADAVPPAPPTEDAAGAPDGGVDAGDTGPSVAHDPLVFLRIVADEPAAGLRASLSPPQTADADPTESLAALSDPRLVAVFDFGRPDDLSENRARARLASGAPTTMVLSPERSPHTVETDVRRLAAWILDTPAVARFDGRPLLFVDGAPGGPEVGAALRHLAALPRPPVVALTAALDDPASGALPPDLPAAAAGLVRARFTSPAEGYASDGTGGLPGRSQRATQDRAADDLRRVFVIWPGVRAARNPRLDAPAAPVEPPMDDAPFARSLVRARRRGSAAIFVEALGAHRDDRQLDPVRGAMPTAVPEALSGGFIYAPYDRRRVSLLRRALLTPPLAAASDRVLGADTPAVVLDASDGVTVQSLQASPADGETPARWFIELEDRTATGRLEVLVDLDRFVVPPNARLTYERDDPNLRVEFALAGAGPEPRPDALRALMPGFPPVGRLAIPLEPLVGRTVDEVSIVYEGGTARLSAHVRDLRIEPTPDAAPSR
jgi:hypothetical protein